MTKVTRPLSEKILKVMLLAALSPLLVRGAFKAFDEVTTARLEFPPHMISFAAICAGQDSARLRILKTICERYVAAPNQKTSAVADLPN